MRHLSASRLEDARESFKEEIYEMEIEKRSLKRSKTFSDSEDDDSVSNEVPRKKIIRHLSTSRLEDTGEGFKQETCERKVEKRLLKRSKPISEEDDS
ncbi:unnamed protein product, partial [Thelazia callipaeda]|uniref:Protein Ycf2-like n=1 Tax=Thelazia callipaeda TaxID=103827 RepID=A0A0N5DAX6_THECL